MERFKINMFQCIVRVHPSAVVSLKDIDKTLTVPHKCFAPGSLGKEVVEKDTHQFGSISLKMKLNDLNISVLLFNTHKIKISGGLNIVKDTSDGDLDRMLKTDIIEPIILILYSKEQGYELEKKMVNAIMYRSRSIGKDNFMQFIEKLKKQFIGHHIIMPDIMLKNGNRRGRICAVKVKIPHGKGPFAVDHGGNVQFFSYDCLYNLQKHKSELMNVWL